jgi:hypothetical protein
MPQFFYDIRAALKVNAQKALKLNNQKNLFPSLNTGIYKASTVKDPIHPSIMNIIPKQKRRAIQNKATLKCYTRAPNRVIRSSIHPKANIKIQNAIGHNKA